MKVPCPARWCPVVFGVHRWNWVFRRQYCITTMALLHLHDDSAGHVLTPLLPPHTPTPSPKDSERP